VIPARTPAVWRRSIRLLLSAASLLLLVQAVLLGAFGIARLGDVNRVSEEIRSRWLQDTRLLGDLNNYMSDYRAGEGTYLLSRTPRELAAGAQDLAGLDARLRRAQREYEALPHDPAEQNTYIRFAQAWSAYQVLARQVVALSQAGRQSEATVLYMTDSRHAFDRSSDVLGNLTDSTVARAREASLRADDTYRRARRLIIAAVAVVACLVTATIIYITWWVSGPMLALARRMELLAAHDTSAAIPYTQREDEIGAMARSVAVFRDNAIALAGSQHRLLEQAAALEDALEKEKQLTARQRNFVTVTSHEFRTPLMVIDAQAQRLIKMRERVEPADLAGRAGRIRGAVQRLTGIMDSLLDASRLFDGAMTFQPVEFRPAALLHEVCQLHRDTTPDAVIEEHLDGAPETATGDPRLLFAAVSNLVSNALKYSPAGSRVAVQSRADGAHDWIIAVRDQGIGIADKDRSRLFERFFRGSNAGRVPGSGVGLHMVKMTVELHGGTVGVESLEEAGSIFTIRLPRRTASVPSLGT